MNIKLSLSGNRELDELLKGLPLQYTHKVMSEAHAAAAKPLIERAKMLSPYRTGNLERSLGTEKTTNLNKVSNIGEVIAGPRRSKRYKGQIAHIVEFGTNVRRNRKGANRGAVKKTPFMGPAFDQTKDIVERNIGNELSRKTIAFMKRVLGNKFVR